MVMKKKPRDNPNGYCLGYGWVIEGNKKPLAGLSGFRFPAPSVGLSLWVLALSRREKEKGLGTPAGPGCFHLPWLCSYHTSLMGMNGAACGGESG